MTFPQPHTAVLLDVIYTKEYSRIRSECVAVSQYVKYAPAIPPDLDVAGPLVHRYRYLPVQPPNFVLTLFAGLLSWRR